MSTQVPVRPEAKAAPKAQKAHLAAAFWAWNLACLVVGVLAWANGAGFTETAEIVIFATAPGLIGLVLLARLGEAWASGTAILAWLVVAIGLSAVTGGALSSLAVSFLIPPALARALGSRWVAESASAAVLGYALAAVIAAWSGIAAQVEPLTQLLTAVSLAFAGGLIALERTPDAAREEALSLRVAEVSHELRTPLTHIIGFAEMIEQQILGRAGKRNVEYAGLIRKSGGHLLDLVNDILDVSKLDAGRYEPEFEVFDVRAIVEDVVRLSTDGAEKKQIVLEARLPEAPLMVRADQRAVRRMLINTIGNAVKFTPDSGRIVIDARSEGGKLVLDTIDNGPGIPAAERERLGRPYERGASGAYAEGTGLGLALVRALAQAHGGNLSFHDTPGGGALVRIEAPVLA